MQVHNIRTYIAQLISNYVHKYIQIQSVVYIPGMKWLSSLDEVDKDTADDLV